MKVLLPVITLCLIAGSASAQISELLISEYIEGSSYNKAVEIYNGTDDPINLQDYVLELYSNGSTVPTVISLGNGLIAARDVFIVANPSASASVLGHSDLTNVALNFNGNDALVLRHYGNVIDRIGQVGSDPGVSWSCAEGSTINSTLRRKISVCSGETSIFEEFDPCQDFEFFPSDSFDNLGSHTADCLSVGLDKTRWDSLKANFK